MTANVDQPRSQEYVTEVISYIKKQTKGYGEEKEKHGSNFASVTLCQVVFTSLLAKAAALNDLQIISSRKLESITDSFKDSLLLQLRSILRKPEKLASSSSEARSLKLFAIIDTLSTVGIGGVKLAELTDDAKSFIASLPETEHELVARLETFMTVYSRDTDGELLDTELKGDTLTIYGRQGIFANSMALTAGKSQQEKLNLLKSTFGKDLVGLSQLDKLLAARCIISTCNGLLMLPPRFYLD